MSVLFEMTEILVCGHATKFQDSWNLYAEGKERPDPACTSHSDVKLEGHSKKKVCFMNLFVQGRTTIVYNHGISVYK
jgi:hypothetical protein